MQSMIPQSPSIALAADIIWFDAVIQYRLNMYGAPETGDDVSAFPSPPPLGDDTAWSGLCRASGLSTAERLVLILALMPWLKPQGLDLLMLRNQATETRFTEFGGLARTGIAGVWPTRQTALFILAGDDLERRLDAMRLFLPDAPLAANGLILSIGDPLDPWTALEPSSALLRRICLNSFSA